MTLIPILDPPWTPLSPLACCSVVTYEQLEELKAAQGEARWTCRDLRWGGGINLLP